MPRPALSAVWIAGSLLLASPSPAAPPSPSELLEQAAGLDDPSERRKLLDSALGAARKQGDAAAEGQALEALGDALGEAGDGAKALDAYSRAEAAFVRAGYHRQAGLVILKQLDAVPASDRLDLVLQLERLVAAEKAFDRGNDPILAAETAAQILRSTEDRTVAMSAQIRAARHFFFGYVEGEAASAAYAALRNALETGDWDARFWGEAAFTYLELADAVDKGTYAAELVALSAYAGDVEAAERWAQVVRQGLEAEDDQGKRASLLNNLGFAYAQAGRLDEARKFYEQSLALRTGLARVRVLENLAMLALRAGDCQAAQQKVADAVAAGKQEEETDTGPLLHLVLAGCKRRLGDLDGARAELEAAGQTAILMQASPNQVFRQLAAEVVDGLVPDEQLVELFNSAELLQLAAGHKGASLDIAEPGPAMRALASRHLARGEVDSALYLIEMNKARRVLFAATGDLAGPLKKASARERRARAALAAEVALRQSRLLAMGAEEGPAGRFEALVHRDAAASLLRQFDGALRLRYPPPAGAAESPAFTAFDRRQVNAARIAARLPEGSAFLEYGLVTDARGDRLAGIVVKPKGPPASFEVKLGADSSPEALRRLVADFSASCGDHRVRGVRKTPAGDPAAPGAPGAKAGQDLHAALIAPARPLLDGVRHLIVSPDGPLMPLSFAALPAGEGRLLADEFAVSYALSGGALLMQLERADALGKGSLGGAAGLVVANPDYGDLTRLGRTDEDARKERFLADLPGARAEGTLLAAIFPKARVLAGAKASEAAFRAAAREARFLHLATHGLVDDARGEFSSLVLAPPPAGSGDDGLLTAQEIAQLPLKARLAVLSACSTAQGSFRDGEGTIGLGWAFARAGVPAVVVTEWPVHDEATALFMKGFYGALAKGRSKLAALQEAAALVRADPRYAHPRFWAAFQLVGDWR